MRVDLRRLLDALRRAAWRVAPIPGERFKHTIDAAGAHRIELVLRSDEVEYTPPTRIEPTLGRSAWARPEPGSTHNKGS